MDLVDLKGVGVHLGQQELLELLAGKGCQAGLETQEYRGNREDRVGNILRMILEKYVHQYLETDCLS